MLKNFLIDQFTDFLFPKRCVGCKKPGRYVCMNCLERLHFLAKQECPNCRKPTGWGQLCGEVCARRYCFDQLLVCLRYDKGGLLQPLLKQFKYKFSEELAETFAKVLEARLLSFIQHFHIKSAILVPVPIHKKRLKYRGFNQIKLICQKIKCDFECEEALERKVFKTAQAKLKRAERIENVKNNFALRMEFAGKIKNKIVILVDDVASTCATLNECSKVLKNAGAGYILALVIARG